VRRPVIWSVAGTDSGGGAGLSADTRAADAFGVHLCPVVAAITAQNSVAVQRVQPVGAELIEAQFDALSDDVAPSVVKTGLLASVEAIRAVVRAVDRLRERTPVALVVDPVLCASTGAEFADAEIIAAYRDELLPRATVITPNRSEVTLLAACHSGESRNPAAALCHSRAGGNPASLPEIAEQLRNSGASAVCITGGDATDALANDWIATPHASGWLSASRIETTHTHGSGCTFATATAAALALGFVEADALVLAKMATAAAIRAAYPAGSGSGPVRALAGFARNAGSLPHLSWDAALPATWPAPRARDAPGLYAIVDSAARVDAVLAAGIRTVQLRIKRADDASLRAEISRAMRACRDRGARLFINDHWRAALELGAAGLHLGQEDFLALSREQRHRLATSGIALGISSHSLWELCRAATLVPDYIACGPVWPTETKRMRWRPQGLDNLAWWCATAGAPVVAIGGILSAAEVTAAARCGAGGVCVVRALGAEPAASVPPLQAALEAARAMPVLPVPAMPHPSLDAHARNGPMSSREAEPEHGEGDRESRAGGDSSSLRFPE